MSARALAFDRVLLSVDGSHRTFTADEFLALPLHDRVRFMLARQLTFFAGSETVDRRVALDSLRQRERAA